MQTYSCFSFSLSLSYKLTLAYSSKYGLALCFSCKYTLDVSTSLSLAITLFTSLFLSLKHTLSLSVMQIHPCFLSLSLSLSLIHKASCTQKQTSLHPQKKKNGMWVWASLGANSLFLFSMCRFLHSCASDDLGKLQ